MYLKRQLSRISPVAISFILLFAAVMTYILIKAFAATGGATLYTSPSGTQSVKKGQSFTLSIRISTANNASVTGASVYLSYPANLLKVTGESYSGSAYNTQLVVNNSSGVLRMDRAAFPLISGGDKLFAQVTFQALATGSASIGFTGDSIVTSGVDDSNILTQRKGVSYVVSAPTSSSSSSTSKSSSSGSAAPPSSSTSSTSNTEQNTSSTPNTQPATGNNSNSPSQKSSIKPTSNTQPSTNDSGNNSINSFSVIVVDQQNNPVEAAEVAMNGQTVKTDQKGVASFQSVPLGQQNITVSYKGKKTFASAEVKSASTSDPAQPQSYTVKINKNKLNPFVLLIPAGLIILIAGAFFFLRPKWMARKNLHGLSDYDQDTLQPVAAVTKEESTQSVLARLKTPDMPQPGSSYKPVAGSNPQPNENDNSDQAVKQPPQS